MHLLWSASDDIDLASRPREGDLVFFPLGQRLFEIKFVEHEDPFYQLGKHMFTNLSVNYLNMKMKLLTLHSILLILRFKTKDILLHFN